ncbi:unnamed protein product [Phytophthora lilii]|uniref:Unnamed protein product n=1 Tax=Phytophthora lilii TaxID=2077276 RepID=A0A9W6X6K7_9STRA|nr:unnamed protein product [Phytophthora lilii]
MTWTAVVHPTIMVPLQDSILHLQQRNEIQRERTHNLNKVTALMQQDEQNLLVQAHETREHVTAGRAFRTEVEAQICRAQHLDRELATQIEAEEVKLQWIRGEVDRLHTQNGSADLEVAQINKETDQLVAATAELRVHHERQEVGRDNVAAQRAIKCEMVGMLRQFPRNEVLQARALRALLVMCKKPKLWLQVLRNGLQDALIEVLQQQPRHSIVYLGACHLITLLLATANDLVPMETWRTRDLVDALLAAYKSVNPESATIRDEVCTATAETFRCLKAVPELQDIDTSG